MNHAEMYLDLMSKVVTNQVNPENGFRIKRLLDKLAPDWPDERRLKLVAELVSLHAGKEDWWTRTLAFPFSMVSPERMNNVRTLVEAVIETGVPGDLVEAGVWRGGACMMMKAVLKAHGDTERKVYVCDSFKGLPMASHVDRKIGYLHGNPMLSAPVDDVRSHFARLGLLDERVVFVEGVFSETMPVLWRSDPKQVAILRVDADYYDSTMDVLNALYDKVSESGYVIIDDYHTYRECSLAVDNFRNSRGIEARLVEIDGQAVYWCVTPASVRLG